MDPYIRALMEDGLDQVLAQEDENVGNCPKQKVCAGQLCGEIYFRVKVRLNICDFIQLCQR